MLRSTIFPCLTSGPLSLSTDDCLVYAYVVLAFLLSIVAYDYQEIGFLVTIFIMFYACVGFNHVQEIGFLVTVFTMYVPNELYGGMIGLSITPANAAILFLWYSVLVWSI